MTSVEMGLDTSAEGLLDQSVLGLFEVLELVNRTVQIRPGRTFLVTTPNPGSQQRFRELWEQAQKPPVWHAIFTPDDSVRA